MDYAATHGSVNANSLMAAYGMKPTTARQYLSTLAKVSRQPSILFRWRGGLRAMHGTHFCWLYRGCYALP